MKQRSTPAKISTALRYVSLAVWLAVLLTGVISFLLYPQTFAATNTSIITNSTILTPGAWGNIALGGSKTLTLQGTGTYVFKSIKNSGTTNKFVFDFQNSTTGIFKIFIEIH